VWLPARDAGLPAGQVGEGHEIHLDIQAVVQRTDPYRHAGSPQHVHGRGVVLAHQRAEIPDAVVQSLLCHGLQQLLADSSMHRLGHDQDCAAAVFR